MRSIEITTISVCRNFCDYCPQHLLIKRYGKKELLQPTVFRTCLNKIPKDVLINFAGYAEPFLNSLASLMMRQAFDNGYKISLYTTLVGLTPQDVDVIKSCKFEYVSLHLPDSEGILKADVNSTYVENAQYFKNHIPYGDSHVYGQLHPQLVELFPNTQRREFKNLHTRAGNVDVSRTKEFTTELNHVPRLTGKIACGVVKRRNNGDETLNFGNVLMPNADVEICCMDYGLVHKIGNLLTDSYESLFTSDEYLRLIAGLEDDTMENILCRTCAEAVKVI